MITAAADGSALGNPGPAGWAWYVDHEHWRRGGWPHGTNNQGELMAVLDLFQSTAHLPDSALHILCDSQYVIKALTEWMPGWKRKGWRKADGKPVLNEDLLKRLDAAMQGRTFEFEWVKGHAGHPLNEAADENARAAATAFASNRIPEAGPGFDEGTSSPRDVSAGSGASGTSANASDNRVLGTNVAKEKVSLENEAAVLGERLFDLERDALTDAEAFSALLAPEYREVTPFGEVRLAQVSETFGTIHPTALAFVDAIVNGDTAIVISRASYLQGTAIHVSTWQRRAEGWVVCLRQSTPER